MGKKHVRVHQEALGIRVGDIVRTSYGTGPYEVWSIYGPRLWDKGLDWIIYPWPVISLVLVTTKEHPRHGRESGTSKFSYVNEIRQEDDRWFTTTGDEVFVNPPPSGYPNLSLDMFRSHSPQPGPYPF